MNRVASFRSNHAIRFAFAAWATALAAACGDPEPAETFTLDSGGDPVLDTGGFRLADSAEPDTAFAAPDVPDITAVPDAGADADAKPDVDAVATADVEAPPPITSCDGVCGLFLENNDCHCNHACVDNGDCCEDFDVACGCEIDADCDDVNDCSSDECVTCTGGKCCKQIPLPAAACCKDDAACPKGDGCNTPKCITGSCTVEKKDCDDKVACTTDNCDGKTGECVHKIQVGKCVIGDECKGGGDLDPKSDGCSACEPGKSQTAWTAKADKCLIGGACIAKLGTPAGATCAVCDPAKSTSAWTLKTGFCLIEDKCYGKDAKNPANLTCEVCDPASSTTAWSGVAGKCAIEGACVAANATNPAAPGCSLCDPAKSKAGWTIKAGFCLIGGKCIGNGKGETAAAGCTICDTAKSTSAWTVKTAGAACDDGNICTKPDSKCDAAGECAGGTAVANCCKDDADCTETPPKCEIAFCDKAKGTCGFKKDTTCCSTGVCCDIPSGKSQEKGFKCASIKIGVEYQCSGQEVQSRELYPGCTGVAPTCSNTTPSSGEWKTTKTCAEGTTCTLSSPTSAPVCKSS